MYFMYIYISIYKGKKSACSFSFPLLTHLLSSASANRPTTYVGRRYLIYTAYASFSPLLFSLTPSRENNTVPNLLRTLLIRCMRIEIFPGGRGLFSFDTITHTQPPILGK